MEISNLLSKGVLTTLATIFTIAGYNQMDKNVWAGIGLMLLGGIIYTAIVVLNKHGYNVSGRQ